MVNKYYLSGTIVFLLVLSGVSVEYFFTKDDTTIKKDGVIIAKYKWHVESERTFINKITSYDNKTRCPKILALGGRETATRCYYPEDYYEQLSRSIINTRLYDVGNSLIRTTPYYAYGTKGAYAGVINESAFFEDTNDFEGFPKTYQVYWLPKDSRNYKLVFRVWNLKNQSLPNGNHTACKYSAGNIKIDLWQSCIYLDYAEVKDDRIWFYYDLEGISGSVFMELKIVDPIIKGYNVEVTEKCDSKQVCSFSEVNNKTVKSQNCKDEKFNCYNEVISLNGKEIRPTDGWKCYWKEPSVICKAPYQSDVNKAECSKDSGEACFVIDASSEERQDFGMGSFSGKELRT